MIAVVLRGPDNLLREAARIRPSEDGSWSIDGLEPGRYRIQLDAGGSRVLVTRPAFRTVSIEAEGTAVTADFAVVRAL